MNATAYKMKVAILAMTILFAGPSLASSAGGDHSVPWALVGQQVFNLVLVFVMLTYFLKTPVRNYFAGRYDEFNKLIREAEEARSSAEKKRQSIAAKIKE